MNTERCGKCGGPAPEVSCSFPGACVDEVEGRCPKCDGPATKLEVRAVVTSNGTATITPLNHPRPTKMGLLTADSRDTFHKGHCSVTFGPRGGVEYIEEGWRINGRMQMWTTRPEEFILPVKYGFRAHGVVAHYNAHEYHLASKCLRKALPGDRETVVEALLRAVGGPLEPEGGWASGAKALTIDCALYFPKTEEI